VAGKHRRNPHHRARHRKPASAAQRILPVGTAVAVLTVGGVVFGQSLANGSSAQGRLTPAPYASVLAFHATRPQRHEAPQHPATQPSHHGHRHTLRIVDTGSPCYVQVSNRHGRILVRRILHAHERLTFRRHGLDVTLGNAGAVRVAINRAHFRRVGSAGQVRHLRVR